MIGGEMPPRKTTSGGSAQKTVDDSERPDVIIDFRFEQGLLYIALVNISDVPAYRVSVKFAKPFRGLGGECAVSSLPVFRRVEFLAPHKCIETLLDSSRDYFRRREPTLIKAQITFRDARGRLYQRDITHDLKIYKEISYVVKRDPALSPHLSQSPGAVEAASPAANEDATYGRSKRQSLLQFQLPR